MTDPYYADDSVTLYTGDCLDVLRELPNASVDAVVTDPPYGLEFMGRAWDSFGRGEASSAAVAGMARTGYTDGADRLDRPSFMGGTNPKCRSCGKWQRGGNPCACDEPDFPNERRARSAAFGEWCEQWAAECLRVLKPGGHMLAFGGTRTWHRLACAIEDAGFEVRDSIAWLYGSGFPKSLDVSKAIDRQRGDHPDWRAVGQWLKGYREAAGYATRSEFAPLILNGHKNLDSAAANLSNWENGLSFPTWDRWLQLRELLAIPDDMDAEVWRLNGRKGSPSEAWAQREVVGTKTAGIANPDDVDRYTVGGSRSVVVDITAPATDDARTWQGWGTALKPAFEPVVVARKPLGEGTVAANVLRHGTGALNIDATRIGMSDADREAARVPMARLNGNEPGGNRGLGRNGETFEPAAAGRWPANVVLDESQAAELDRQSGDGGSGSGQIKVSAGTKSGAGSWSQAHGMQRPGAENTGVRDFGDTGGASRFFYVAKAPTAERPREDGIAHPTVKPLDLMRWLVRLVTPPGGVVLEPFAGSGTTAEACVIEGFRCIAIEREADYLPLIVQRLTKPIQPTLFGGDFA